ncbi:MAG: SusC/RagA family TonB-linked outer membrane protein [Niabella sp.]
MLSKRLFAAMFSLLLVLSALVSNAQVRTVSGKVTDSKDGSPIPNVTVAVKGTSFATQTNADGNYAINVPATATQLEFSSVNYTSQTLTISGPTVDAALTSATSIMESVVVVAYGTKKKSDLTGSVTAISAKDFQKGNVASTEQLLVGKVAGLEVTSGGGSAGGGSRIRIRGGASLNASNDPLIVIDGLPVEGNGISGSSNLLNTINPDDIESISVLKDASATALYGSRASNGVMIITTKKGKSGKFQFNFNTKQSVSVVGDKVDVLTGDEIRDIVTKDAAASGLNTWKDLLGTANTNWQDLIYQNAYGNENNLSATGALKFNEFVLPVRASVGYLDQDGVLRTNNFKRISSSLNLSPKFFKDHLAVNVNAKYANTKNRFADEGAIGSAIVFDPTQVPYDPASKWGGYFQWLKSNGEPINTNGGSIAPNPLDLLYLRDNRSTVDRVVGNVQLDYKFHFLPDLHFLVNFGMDNSYGSGTDLSDSSSVSNWQTKGRVTQYKQNKKNQLTDVSFTYAKRVSDVFNLDALVLHSYQTFKTDVFNYASYGQDGKVIEATVPRFDTDYPEFRLESYLGRLNMGIYNFLFTASLRRDASSKFTKDNRVGYFPAFALAWKMKDELFANSDNLNELKLRLGWGKTGNQDGIGNYYSSLRFIANQNGAALYQLGDQFYEPYRPENFNSDLTWEKTTTSNIGLDYGFFRNRINGTVDFYLKKTKDLLSVVPIAPGAGYGIDRLENVGNIENKGVEIAINTTPYKSADFSWDFNINGAYNKTKITHLRGDEDPNFKGIDVSGISGGTGNNIGRFAIGYAPYAFYVRKQVYDANNKPIEGLYEDIDGKGTVDDNDRYFYKKPAADVTLGASTSFTYKRLTLGVAGHGGIGNYLYNNFNSVNSVLRNIKDPLFVVRNAGVDYRNTLFSNNNYWSDYYIENASFFRIDNVNVGFNAGKILYNKASLRLNFSIQNVYTFTKYSGLDPESSNSTGVDFTTYPRPRIFTVGASLDF